MTILERIIQLRNERDWSEYRLSVESEIPQSTISSWFVKNVKPSSRSLEKICKAFNMTMTQFFAFENEPVTLTDKQRQVLDNWNKLNPKQQDIILELLKSMLP
ncbi:MAG: helix-turn-helix domain-containing protein [Ruminococcus sp.]|nr:helix-turn-helix domain-containing protein [Ruminococcus sp.]MCM1480785.1 helix-turn-helix domain-containing protein [Muribaculaceae bacterium]